MPCPEWEYEHHPDRITILQSEVQDTLIELRSDPAKSLEALIDTRETHKRLFSKLAPPGLPYYAGNYRGSNHRCLEDYEVTIGSSRGYPADQVPSTMDHFSVIIRSAITRLDGIFHPQSSTPQDDQLLALVSVAADIFTYFLVIHPYANGNGHIARFMVWALLGRYGYWVQNWPIEPRPGDPPYSDLVRQSVGGNRQPLERFILLRLAPLAYTY